MMSTPSGEILKHNSVKNCHASRSITSSVCYSLSDFVDVVSAINQVIKESTGSQLFVLSLWAHAEQSDAFESANQLSNGLTLQT